MDTNTMVPARNMLAKTLTDTIRAEINNNHALLHEISRQIHSHPETSFQEFFAHDYLTNLLEQQFGFAVERKYAGIPTAFRAETASKTFQKIKHATVVICCEYDALPQIDHACGHNLIAETSIGAFLGLAAAIKNDFVPGRAILLGTPAEEGGGGKIKLIEAGAFRDADFAMMAHGAPVDAVSSTILAYTEITATFTGRAAHAAAGPWEGVNALDACVAAYNSLAMIRQQIKPYNRLHAIIVEGGVKANIIPERAVLQVGCRSPTQPEVRELLELAVRIVKCAADSHACSVDVVEELLPYTAMMYNKTLGNVYAKYEQEAGTDFAKSETANLNLSGSTDMGNVSLQLPSIHPFFMPCAEAADVMLHTTEFCTLAGTSAAQQGAIRVAKSLACAAAEVLGDAELLQVVKDEFERDIKQMR